MSNGDYELPYDEYEEREPLTDYDPELFSSLSEAQDFIDTFSDNWHQNEGGFSAEDMYDMITHVETWYDDEGYMHYHFEWESEDGNYGGSYGG